MTNTFQKFKETVAKEWIKFRPIMFAHHPSCKYFIDHTMNVKKFRFCIGCFIGYPSALIAFLLFNNLYFSNHDTTPLFLIFGILCFLPILLSFTEITKIKPIKIGQKFAVGIGSGMILAYFFALINPPNFIEGFLLFFGITTILITPVGFLHYRTMTSACGNCPDQWNPEVCDISYCMAPRKNRDQPREMTDSHENNINKEN